MPPAHPPEFRRRAIELARERAKPIAQIAADIGISESCLRTWLRQADVDDGRREGLTTEERVELVRLRRDNRVLRMEKEILGKAAVGSTPPLARPRRRPSRAPSAQPEGNAQPIERPLGHRLQYENQVVDPESGVGIDSACQLIDRTRELARIIGHGAAGIANDHTDGPGHGRRLSICGLESLEECCPAADAAAHPERRTKPCSRHQHGVRRGETSSVPPRR